MSKSNTYETDLLKLIFHGNTISGIANNYTPAPSTNLYLSLHTADPGEAGDQSTNETTYTSYARYPVLRSPAGWMISGNTANLIANADFVTCTGGTATITHFGIGANSMATIAGYLLYKGTVTPNISVSSGVTPRLTTATNVVEE